MQHFVTYGEFFRQLKTEKINTKLFVIFADAIRQKLSRTSKFYTICTVTVLNTLTSVITMGLVGWILTVSVTCLMF